MKKFIISIFFIIFFLNSFLAYSFSASYKQLHKKYIYSRYLYKKLKSKKIKNKRVYSSKVIENLYYIYKVSKYKDLKIKSLFLIGQTYYFLCRFYGSEIFADLAIGSFYRFVKEFPKSTYCDDAKYYSARIYYYYKNIPKLAINELRENITYYPKGDFYKKSKKFLNLIYKQNSFLKKEVKIVPKSKYKIYLKQIRTFGLKKFGRIVFDLTKLPQYSIKKENGYLYIKLFNVGKSKRFRIISLNKNKIKNSILFSIYSKSIKVKLKIKYITSYNCFTLKNPNRIVLDFEINKRKVKRFIKPHDRISTIIIDPGHGGHDPGATYYGLQEKDVALKIGRYLRYYLKKYLSYRNYTILMTRDDDTFLSLEERAKFANENNADLFISIHCNANRNRKLHGFETYYLNYYKNQKYLKKISYSKEVYYILEDLIRSAKFKESIEFAQIVQTSLVNTLSRRYSNIRNLGIQDAPFYVLMGTRMPAILVENSFISNKMENRRLRSSKYLKLISKGIAKGIVNYIHSQNFVK